MVGYTQQQSAYDGFNAGSYGFLNDNLQMNNLGSGTTYTAPGSEVKKWALNSYLARVNYTVNNKYLLTASIRADVVHPVSVRITAGGIFPFCCFGMESF